MRTGYWVVRGVSPYSVLPPAPGLSFANVYSSAAESTTAYLPFWPLVLGAIYKLYTVVGFGDRFVYYFLIKQPIILGDLALGYLIAAYVKAVKPVASQAALAFWILSPLTIIISSIWGMFDALAMTFVFAALITRRASIRSIWGGIAIWAKSIPIVFTLPLALSGGKRLRNVLLCIGLPTILSVGTIALLGWPLTSAFNTVESTVSKGGQSLSLLGIFFYTQQFTSVTWPATLLQVAGYLWIPAVLIASLLAYRWFGFDTERGLVESLILCSVAFVVFKAQVNEQYSIYPLALILVDAAIWNPRGKWFYVAVTAVVTIFLVVNDGGMEEFLSPISPIAAYKDTEITIAWGNTRYAVLFVCSLLFSSLNLAYAWLIVRGRERKRDGSQTPGF